MSSTDPAVWLRRYHPVDDNAPRLICFPHAGGSASYYFPFSRAVADTGAAEVSVVQYPGRQDRHREACLTDLRQLARCVVDAVLACDDGRPVSLFGHSMGALLAFEVALQLQEGAGLRADRLFVSGRRSPSRATSEKVHLRDEQGLMREVRALDGTGSSMLDDPDIRAMILPPLRADYEALETYRYSPARRLTIPVDAFVGDSDPRTPVEDAGQWGAVTSGDFELCVLPGGHFYLVEQWTTLAAHLGGRLAGIGEPTSRRL
ncbi:alpha/beta fold hydrolase [Streptomyces sp. NBC_00704]|uniref:thioesterase II family protein n=1 Tax=Streptomyces sp. NBC_00704 TaxID=2975809 RepID=UPI002E34D3DB|nr:alpha/beta fold hydrolase [Streptomyces sp. NBC_00704]